jgi:hypothetical protein
MLPKTLRDAAEVEQHKGNNMIAGVMREAADSIERKDTELWAINAELVKAGFEPWKYESFALCVAEL